MTTDTAAPAAPAAPAPAAAPAAPAPAPVAPATPPADPAAAPAAPATAPTAEQIAADAAASEAAAAAAAAKPAGAPETYADFTPPAGAVLDAGVMTKFAEAAKSLNLPQEAAQALVDQMAPVMAAQQAAQVDALKAEWLATATADPEVGGAKLTESLAFAAKAMDQFATPALKDIFTGTGFGNHPDVLRFMVKVGRAMSEDRVLLGGNTKPAGGIRSTADVLYPASSKP